MEQNKKLKPFNLEKAKQGAKITTRNGRSVRIICWDRVDKKYPIVALVKDKDGIEEDTETFTLDGVCVEGENNNLDLFMAPTTVEKWVNMYKYENGAYYNGRYYNSEQEALQYKDNYSDYVTTTKISWRE